MKLGYACINRTLNCIANRTFRLSSYSKAKLHSTVSGNLDALEQILRYNAANGLMFFRISSETIPFASHPVCDVNWEKTFAVELQHIGGLIRKHGMRISMHPGQYTLINSPNETVVENSIRELDYHCRFLDGLGLDDTAKIQIHVGGVYGDKDAAIKRFISTYNVLSPDIRRRLAIENDDTSFSLVNCMTIHNETGVPVIFDNFHHECLNNGEPMTEALKSAAGTWKTKDGIMMVDYSSQAPGEKKGKHISEINLDHFQAFLNDATEIDFDIMLEIKNKEISALKALPLLTQSHVHQLAPQT